MKKIWYRILRWWYRKHLVNVMLDIGTPKLGEIFDSHAGVYTIKHYGNDKYLILTSKKSRVKWK